MCGMTTNVKWKWVCPECAAPKDDHGRGDCGAPDPDYCEGLLCECTAAHRMEPDHGEVRAKPCTSARCDHCGWQGEYPNARVLYDGLAQWQKTALLRGWTPPDEAQA